MPLGSTCLDLACLALAWLTCRSLQLWLTTDFLWSACLGARCQLLWGPPPQYPSARYLPPALTPQHAACALHFALHLSAQQLTLHCGVAPALTPSTLPAPCTHPSAHCLRPALSTVPVGYMGRDRPVLRNDLRYGAAYRPVTATGARSDYSAVCSAGCLALLKHLHDTHMVWRSHVPYVCRLKTQLTIKPCTPRAQHAHLLYDDL